MACYAELLAKFLNRKVNLIQIVFLSCCLLKTSLLSLENLKCFVFSWNHYMFQEGWCNFINTERLLFFIIWCLSVCVNILHEVSILKVNSTFKMLMLLYCSVCPLDSNSFFMILWSLLWILHCVMLIDQLLL